MQQHSLQSPGLISTPGSSNHFALQLLSLIINSFWNSSSSRYHQNNFYTTWDLGVGNGVCMCLTFHPCPCEDYPASHSDLVVCPGSPEQHNNMDVPPKLFVMVFIKNFFSVQWPRWKGSHDSDFSWCSRPSQAGEWDLWMMSWRRPRSGS